MDKKVTNSKGSQKTKMSKESILNQYKDDLIEIFKHLTKTYKINSDNKYAKKVKDIIIGWRNKEEVTFLNIRTIEEILEKLIIEVDLELHRSIYIKINTAK